MKRGKGTDLGAVLARISKEGLATLLTKGEAAAVIAARTMDRNDSVRGARNRVATRIDRAVKSGKHSSNGGLEQRADGRFEIGNIVFWAQIKYSHAAVTGLPEDPKHHWGILNAVLPELQCRMVGYSLPSDVKECHAVILDLHERIRQMEERSEEKAKARKAEIYSRLKKK